MYLQLANQQMHIHKIVYIKTFKIAPTCFDPKIIFRELHCSYLKMILSNDNIKNSWTPMILKLWILRLNKTRIWLTNSTTRRLTNQYIPTTRYRQPSSNTNKLTNSNNCNSSRYITLVNSTETWGKNRCHTRPTKSSKIFRKLHGSSLKMIVGSKHVGESTALARTRTLRRSSSITQYKQHDMLPHHHS